ncbi:2-succinyl-5-enolpyruvyl-6-hydroxy-3-cyclohexene-1-carboxylic-acid synthase [Psychromicrobium lacuslunae]|uniref:2-succinyl-5-enolpyruvyl-6-hydroxy-3-cyclohexene-1-carboxylate synthase n=1 Tax=Psychromicrobium lacuslunae TaxID=1618207 RepID=A0A0D4C0D4_9MICC|nr:2-succinyl-5-enolpyruvyl-6-hydroxy-3-cyclohexene-1-carboxylic-acid synthase [Psychromicrobium lacuslunae]AJT41880.1 2-succinyl-5-enolpyruvyl-6-hydroxy-3-cyclohexene-1-carboxylate synthase [Psychromicrobium lacuslunae]
MDVARRVVSELAAGGIRQLVLAPGSRSAPLAYALAEAEAELQTLVRIDERAAAFTALGLSLASGLPVAVLTTSGTAVGNLMPAVMEANHAGVPLIVLSADRPEELRGTGANQTTDQVDLFGSHLRFAADLAAGQDPQKAVQTGLDAAKGLLSGVPRGPVQLNLSFRDPLTPALDGSDFQPTAIRQTAVHSSRRPVESLAAPRSTAPRRTVVLAGHAATAQAEEFARLHGLPLLAEPSSDARFGPHAVGPYRLLLEHFGAQIERVVVFGRPTLSRPVAALLNRQDLPRALYLPEPVAWFQAGRRSERLIHQLTELSDFAGLAAEGWLQSWQQASRAAETALAEVLADDLSGLQLAAEVWRQPVEQLVLGSSNPIRDVDLAGTPGVLSPRVFANRGLAGIDGTVSTASGVALATDKPTRLLLGDLTLLHDAGGLLLPRGERVPDLQIIVLNDAGGGIFSVLEHGALGEQPAYASAVERLFGTAQDVGLEQLAAAYGVQYRLIGSRTELVEALQAPFHGRSVLEIRTERSALRGLHDRVKTAINEGLRALG